jgi:hypothetical protein
MTYRNRKGLNGNRVFMKIKFVEKILVAINTNKKEAASFRKQPLWRAVRFNFFNALLYMERLLRLMKISTGHHPTKIDVY